MLLFIIFTVFPVSLAASLARATTTTTTPVPAPAPSTTPLLGPVYCVGSTSTCSSSLLWLLLSSSLGFIEAIVTKLSSFENVDSNNFTIMGSSNGAALVNQIAIESKLPNIRNYISGVSQLNVWQYDGKNFKAKGNDNNYRKSVAPATGKRLLNISGAKDNLVPYEGGNSRGIPAKNGKLGFVAAEKSTFLNCHYYYHSTSK